MAFKPSEEILERYARVLVDFALGGGEGIKEKEVVYLQFDSPALPLAFKVYQRILEKGAHPMVKIIEEDFSRLFYKHAKNFQLEFFPKRYAKALIDTIDHRVYILGNRDPLYLKSADPKKIAKANKANRLFKRWFFAKEDRGQLTWTLALYPTRGQAKEAGLSLKDYWQQVIRACFLDFKDPTRKWQKVFRELEKIKKKINSLGIKKLHITAKDTDLWVDLGERRKFVGGSGRNIPSFELFTSPDWRGVEGRVFFDQPVYRYGNLIKGVYLEFKRGRVVKAKAVKNENLLKTLIAQKNADKVGEFSLTDRRFSRINKFMAHILYDENFGGKYGNTHLALGSSYHDCFDGDVKKLKAKDWKRLGFNESAEHMDIISTTDRVVVAYLKNRVEKVIYKKGQFLI